MWSIVGPVHYLFLGNIMAYLCLMDFMAEETTNPKWNQWNLTTQWANETSGFLRSVSENFIPRRWRQWLLNVERPNHATWARCSGSVWERTHFQPHMWHSYVGRATFFSKLHMQRDPSWNLFWCSGLLLLPLLSIPLLLQVGQVAMDLRMIVGQQELVLENRNDSGVESDRASDALPESYCGSMSTWYML